MKNLLLIIGLLFGCNQNHCKMCERHTGADMMALQRDRLADSDVPHEPRCYAIEKLMFDPYEPLKEIDEQHPMYAVSGWWGIWDNTREHLDSVGEYSARWFWWNKAFTNINDATTYLLRHTELRPLCGGKISVGEL